MMVLITLSLAALVIAALMHLFVGVVFIKAIAIFLGLEATILLSSSMSQDSDDINVDRPANFFRAIVWHFGEGRHLNYPVNYNPVFFYLGLVLLAISFILSEVPTAS